MRQRGYTVPRGALYALRVANAAPWLQLPLTAPVVLGAARTHRSKIRKQAPLAPYALAVVTLLLTQNRSMPFGLRAVASGIALMSLAAFRRGDAQWVAEIDRNDSVVLRFPIWRGLFLSPSIGLLPYGGGGRLNYPRWNEPTLKARALYSAGGAKPRLISPHCNGDWPMDSSRPTKYATSLAFLRRPSKMCGFAVEFTPRCPREILPTRTAQIGWRKDDRTALWRRAPNSAIPTWYDRTVGKAEPRFRNEIIKKVNDGRKPSADSELPNKKPAQQGEGALSSAGPNPVVTSSSSSGEGV